MTEEFSNFITAERAARLYNNSCFSDAILITGKGNNVKSFYVHSLILKITSPIFESMLQEGKELKLPNIDPSVMEAILKYIYTDILPEIPSDIAIKTYYAADYFKLTHLKSLCCDYIYTIISPNNAVEIYEFAFQNGIPSVLSKSAVILFKEIEKVLRINGLNNASHDTILKIIQNVSPINEKQLMKNIVYWTIQKNDKFEDLLKSLIPHFRLKEEEINEILSTCMLTSEKYYDFTKFTSSNKRNTASLEHKLSLVPLNLHLKNFNKLKPLKKNDIFSVVFFTELDCFIEAIALPLISKIKTFYTMNFEINFTDLKSKHNFQLPSSPKIFLQCEINNLSKFRLHYPLYVKKRTPMKLEVLNLEQVNNLDIVRHRKVTGQFEWKGESIAYIPNYHDNLLDFQISGLLLCFSNI